MHLTGYGENFIRSDRSTRLFRGNQLLAAGSEDDYITIDLFEAGCYDAAVYLRFLFGAGISLNTLRGTSSQNWIPILNFRAGEQWNGYSALPFGKAIGFMTFRRGIFSTPPSRSAMSISAASMAASSGRTGRTAPT